MLKLELIWKTRGTLPREAGFNGAAARKEGTTVVESLGQDQASSGTTHGVSQPQWSMDSDPQKRSARSRTQPVCVRGQTLFDMGNDARIHGHSFRTSMDDHWKSGWIVADINLSAK